MSSPALVTIHNYTKSSLTTKVVVADWVEEDGRPINGLVIPNCSGGTNRTSATVVAKTAHDGSLEVSLLNSSNQTAGTFTIKSIKDPQNGEKSLQVVAAAGYVVSEMGYRSSPGNEDLRRVDVLIAQC
jgi:hypothetical protein